MLNNTQSTPWWQRILKRLVVAAGIFVLSVVVLQWNNARNAAQDAHRALDQYVVGECLLLTRAQDSFTLDDTKTSCDQDPSYTVASRIGADDHCPADSYSEYSITVKGDKGGKLCLMENMTAGHCYQNSPFNKTIESVGCGPTAMGRSFQVISRSETNEPKSCPPTTNSIAYPQPARTYCIAQQPKI